VKRPQLVGACGVPGWLSTLLLVAAVGVLAKPMSEIGTMAISTGEHQERGWRMTEQVPKDQTEAEEADRLEADRSEDEGDTASEVDRWDEGGHDRAG
jgi:hypothetical protein